MKILNFLQDIDNRIIKPMQLKKQFEHKNHVFAVVIEPGQKHKYYTLMHVNSGGKLPMYKEHNKTIKDFVFKSIESIDELIQRITLESFENTLNSQPKIN